MFGYGSMEPSDHADEETVQLIVNKEEFEEPFDHEFWKLVHRRYEEKVDETKWKTAVSTGRFWSSSMDEIRAQRIKGRHSGAGKDPVVAIMKDWVEIFNVKTKDEEREKLLPSFESQLSRLATILIDQECEQKDCSKLGKHKCKYGGLNPYVFTDLDGTKKTLLHIAAEQGLSIMTVELISRFPGHVYVSSLSGPEILRIPLEFALKKSNDEVASTIIKKMRHERVRMLFEFNKTEGRCRFRFRDIIEQSCMKKTVIAILDCLVSPDWPYIPVEKPGQEEKEWSNIPDIPVRYHFFYRILDGDDEGRHPTDKNFNQKADSCFKLLLMSPHKKTIVYHPVFRVLANSKWDNFGRFRVRLYAVIFALYLITMSIALLGSVKSKDPSQYNTAFDYFRGVCEIVTLFGAVVYFLLELGEITAGLRCYVKDIYNYADMFGIILLVATALLRFIGHQLQWSVAAAAYLVNFFRVFKYFPAWKFIGLYSKVLAQMLLKDFTKFIIVYIFVMFSFAGCIFLALKATNGLSNVGNFGDLLLKELRVLAEGKEFSDSYSTFNIVVVLVIEVNMLMILIMLINMFIAQLSYRFENAQANAELQYDVDKSLMVAKLEQSRFKRFNLRVLHYKDGDYVVRKSDVNEIILCWDKLKEQLQSENLPGLAEREAALAASRKDQFTGVVKV